MRFIERVCRINVEELRQRILTPTVIDAVRAGASAVIVEGVKFIVRDNVIITTLDEDQRVKKRDRKHVRAVEEPSLKEGLEEYFDSRETAQSERPGSEPS